MGPSTRTSARCVAVTVVHDRVKLYRTQLPCLHTRSQNEDKRQTDRQAMFPTVGYLFPEGYGQLPTVASNEELEVGS